MKARLSKAALVAAGFGTLLSMGVPSAAYASTHGDDYSTSSGRTLAAGTRFFVPPPPDGSLAQVVGLARHGDIKDASLLAQMVTTPQAVWFSGTTKSGAQQTPEQVARQVRSTMWEARAEGSVPMLVIYDIPGRDCSQYSSGGAPTDTAYQQWVTGFAQGLGQGKAVILVEPDALANLPSYCSPGAYSSETNPPTDATRLADVSFDVNLLEQDPNASVYLDAGNSAWQNVGTMASTLIQAGVQNAQGFFLNVSNYQYSQNSVQYGTWVSDCIAWTLKTNDANPAADCPNQYWNGGPNNQWGNPSQPGGWSAGALSPYGVWSDGNANHALDSAAENLRYASMMSSSGAVATAHFVIDTSRNGLGPDDMSTYSAAPYNQPSSVITALQAGNWCNPPGRGLGIQPTANTSSVSPLLDAYLWVKTPGQSDGQCDSAGAVRTWDNASYTPPIAGWPAQGTSAFSTFDPLWSVQTGTVTTDPAAGAWFPQQALQLAQMASPSLSASPWDGWHFHFGR